MAASNDSLICPLTLELFRDPVIAQDGHTYEREAIEEWIRKSGTSPITRQPISIEHLISNLTVKKIIDSFETLVRNKNYQFILDVDVKRSRGRPLFSTTGKTLYYGEWLPTNDNRPEIILLKVDGARAKKEASFYVNLTRHPHIVRTFGFVRENESCVNNSNTIMLLQEYASGGSLYELLVDCKTMPNENILIEIFLQIIDAMIFLTYNHVIHGDLACRNVLIFRFDEKDSKKIVVKITDFGLSRHSKLYSMAPGSAKTTLNIIPTRYAAPEILSVNATSENYTEKSDVFSMGVLMWEAYSRGELPWSQIERDEDVVRRVMSGDLLPRPQNCSQDYWSIIIKTWSELPNDRPTFSELKRLLTVQNYRSERLKYKKLQNEKDEELAALPEDISKLKRDLETRRDEIEKYKRILETPGSIDNISFTSDEINDDRDRLEGWVQIPTRNIRRGGWKRQFAVIAKNKLLLYNSEKDQLAAISIDIEKLCYVRAVTQGDVRRVDPNMIPKIFQVLYDSEGQTLLNNSTTTMSNSIMQSQEQDRHTGETIEYKGHSFVIVVYRIPAQCETCNHPCYNVFSPPPCLECTRCHVRCHKQHYDDREEFILPCRVNDKLPVKELVVMCARENEQKHWIAKLSKKIAKRGIVSQHDPTTSSRISTTSFRSPHRSISSSTSNLFGNNADQTPKQKSSTLPARAK